MEKRRNPIHLIARDILLHVEQSAPHFLRTYMDISWRALSKGAKELEFSGLLKGKWDKEKECILSFGCPPLVEKTINMKKPGCKFPISPMTCQDLQPSEKRWVLEMIRQRRALIDNGMVSLLKPIILVCEDDNIAKWYHKTERLHEWIDLLEASEDYTWFSQFIKNNWDLLQSADHVIVTDFKIELQKEGGLWSDHFYEARTTNALTRLLLSEIPQLTLGYTHD